MHKHLTWTDRLKIEQGLRENLKPCEIAQRLHVHNSTIYRELKRGECMHLNSDYTISKRYEPSVSQEKYEENLAAKGGALKIGSDRALAEFIETKIVDEGYSPAAVVAEIKEKRLSFKTTISEKTIYNYIDKGIFLRLTRKNLPEKGRRKRKYSPLERKKAARAPKGDSIENRPQEINERKSFGHWEMDCVKGSRRTRRALLVLSERLTRREVILPIKDMTSASVVAALDKLEEKYKHSFSKIFKSITVDNGSEFSDCEGLERSSLYEGEMRTKVYYCHPYCAFERGTNENTNKLIRRFLPKGTDFQQITDAYIQRVEDWINNYPREVLGFQTAEKLFRLNLEAIT